MSQLAQRLLMASGGKKAVTYVDDVFSTYLYKGNETARSITNSVDNTKGGMIWIKNRDNSAFPPYIFDTESGVNKQLRTSSSAAQTSSGNTVTAFNNNGFSLGNETMINRNNDNQVSWNFREARGFFDIVKYDGNNTNRTIPHKLGSVPGMIWIKQLNSTSPWTVYHRELDSTDPEDYRIFLDEPDQRGASDATIWNSTKPTASNFSLGTNTQLNGSGNQYIAYIFAGGASNAATARSVDFDGTDDKLSIADHADLQIGSSTYTMEFWVYKNAATPDDYDVWAAKGSNSNNTREWAIESFTDQRLEWWYATSGSNWNYFVVADNIPTGQWTHICAQKDSSGYFSFFVNGIRTYYSTTGAQTLNTGPDPFCIGGFADTNNNLDCNIKVSNFRFIKGTALYTNSFIPSTEPLTTTSQGATASNVKLLCCNQSTVTGSTVTPATITANGDPTASTLSPFDDIEGYKFGEEGDQNIIKCGKVTTDTSNGAILDLPWEP